MLSFTVAGHYFIITHDAVPNIVGLKVPTETLCESSYSSSSGALWRFGKPA